jgi:hypothetical protein
METDTELHRLVPLIIDSLLMVGVGDDMQNIRQLIFSSLTPSLDVYIAKSECIHCLIGKAYNRNIQIV